MMKWDVQEFPPRETPAAPPPQKPSPPDRTPIFIAAVASLVVSVLVSAVAAWLRT